MQDVLNPGLWKRYVLGVGLNVWLRTLDIAGVEYNSLYSVLTSAKLPMHLLLYPDCVSLLLRNSRTLFTACWLMVPLIFIPFNYFLHTTTTGATQQLWLRTAEQIQILHLQRRSAQNLPDVLLKTFSSEPCRCSAQNLPDLTPLLSFYLTLFLY